MDEDNWSRQVIILVVRYRTWPSGLHPVRPAGLLGDFSALENGLGLGLIIALTLTLTLTLQSTKVAPQSRPTSRFVIVLDKSP